MTSRTFALLSTSLLALAAAGTGTSAIATGASCTPDAGFDHCEYFVATGAEETLVFPDDLRDSQNVQIELWGAGGAGEYYGGTGGWRGSPGGAAGGYVKLSTTPGDIGRTLYLTVGEGGLANSSTNAFGGGGAGGDSDTVGSGGGGFTGIFGAASWVDPIVIVGGGGGASPGSTTVSVPGGGGSVGDGGQSSNSDSGISGRAGTTTAGGAGATITTGCATAATDGTALQGGNGGSDTWIGTEGGGGGGGGYFGGGGGRCQGNGGEQNGGGGGGSGFVDNTVVTVLDEGVGGNGTMGISGGAAGEPHVTSSIEATAGFGGDGGEINSAEAAHGGDGLIVIQWEVPLGPEEPTPTPTPADLAHTGVDFNISGLFGLAVTAIVASTFAVRRLRRR